MCFIVCSQNASIPKIKHFFFQFVVQIRIIFEIFKWKNRSFFFQIENKKLPTALN